MVSELKKEKIYNKISHKRRKKGGQMNGTDLKIHQGDYIYILH